MILSKREWVKKYVVRWNGIKNCDTHTVEGGYLFLRNDDGSTIGYGGTNVHSRSEAIALYYQRYAEAQSNTTCTRLGGTVAKSSNGEQPPSG
jgi:hypothetical protein